MREIRFLSVVDIWDKRVGRGIVGGKKRKVLFLFYLVGREGICKRW